MIGKVNYGTVLNRTVIVSNNILFCSIDVFVRTYVRYKSMKVENILTSQKIVRCCLSEDITVYLRTYMYNSPQN